jgi:hypothetical protein
MQQVSQQATQATTATAPSPSRSALYRARKRRGEPIGQRRDAEELAALASKPPHQRTSAEKKALRNHKAYVRLKAQRAIGVVQAGQLAAAAAAAAAAASNAIASDARAAAATAGPTCAIAAASPSAPSPAFNDTASSAFSAAAPLAITAAAAATAAASTSAVPITAADDAALAHLSEPHLLRCATTFAAALTNKQQRCLPFTFDPVHLDALRTAVEQRVLRDLASAGTSPLLSAAPAPPAFRLCASDLQLLQSCLTLLQRWPCWMQQQWLAVSAKKIAKSEVG